MNAIDTIPVLSGQGTPAVFNGYRLQEHVSVANVTWHPRLVHLYQPGRAGNPWPRPMTGEEFFGYAARGDHLVNANVLDRVVEQPELFFPSWRELIGNAPMMRGRIRKVYFCGSVFIGPHRMRAIAGLLWDDDKRRPAKFFTDFNSLVFDDSFAVSTHSY